MAEFTPPAALRPGERPAPYWAEYNVDLEPHRSVLEGILQAKDETDGSIGIRCSCRAAICGSCGVMINGRAGLACHTHLGDAQKGGRDGVIEVEPFNNMPVIKDLVVDMDAVHWKKIQRVTPWLINKEPVPERSTSSRTRTWSTSRSRWRASSAAPASPRACRWRSTRCSSARPRCEGLPLRRRPARRPAVRAPEGPRRGPARHVRLHPLLQLHRGVPQGRGADEPDHAAAAVSGNDHHIVDRNNGDRHEQAFATLVKGYGLLHEAELLPRSYGGDSWFGKFHPAGGQELLDSLPVIMRAVVRRKVTPKGALLGHKLAKDDLKDVQRIFEKVEGRTSATSSTSTSAATTRTRPRRRPRPRSWPRRARATVPAPLQSRPARPGSRGLPTR